MTLLDWLEPSIEKRVNEIFDSLWEEDGTMNDVKRKFLIIIKSTKDQSTRELILELENIFILKTRRRVEVSYRAGLSDGVKWELRKNDKL